MTPGPALLERPPDDRLQVLAADGSVLDDEALPDLDDGTLLDVYADMRLARRLDERAVSLQRQGRLGTYPSLAGQEGSQVGATHALRADDWVCYQYREHAVPLVRGLAPEYLPYWMGHEAGNAALADGRIFPLNISIAGHLPHATGLAWAAKLRGDDAVVACHFGDGATSEGDFHEALNVAGVYDVPAVFCCHNNQWAISVPRERQTASETIAQKATAYGFEGVQVDGMDPLASYAAVAAAREKAAGVDGDGTAGSDPDGDGDASGDGDGHQRPRPTLLEFVQYRYGAHTTADDPGRYRDEREVERWRERDPIDRLERFLRDRGLLDDERVQSIEDRIEAEVVDAVEHAEAVTGDPSAMFEHVYAEATPELRRQRERLERLRERHGDAALLEEDVQE